MKGRFHLRDHGVELPDDVLLAVEGLTKAPPRPPAQPPRWLARFLPGVQWSAVDEAEEDDPDDDDLDDDGPKRKYGLGEVSFEVGPGGGLGLIGDAAAVRTLMTLLIGLYPPTTGRIVVRGRIAPVVRFTEMNLSGETGKRAVKVLSGFLEWPPDFVDRRWPDILEFAHLEELEDLGFIAGSLEYDIARTKRLFFGAVMHLDATVYVVMKGFAGSDRPLLERCTELLEERQAAGCAIIHTGRRVEELAHFCHEAVCFENGKVLMRGRLGEVARVLNEKALEAKRREKTGPRMRALLVGGDGELTLGPSGGRIEIELDLFAALTTALTIRFTDEEGEEQEVEQPEPFTAESPGVYRLSIAVPPGILVEDVYRATLLATLLMKGVDDPPRHELLSFDIVANGSGSPDDALGIELEPQRDDMAEADTRDVEWNVERVGA